MVSDNFYTRHLLAIALLTFTEGETILLGTVRMNLVDKWNRKELTASVARVGKMKRGSRELIAVVDVEPGLATNLQGHKQQQKQRHDVLNIFRRLPYLHSPGTLYSRTSKRLYFTQTI
ncbi:hypothetical protein JG688_00011119 [Phytophthora aleatoria]|uniref:PiggyBac transposable element-derived protein domain-containing protein n=1 Tax=Phytophthora aleatoria TaxID=2496075 RepID=A0A8J5IHB1_9STRA|nr:hypothetical protein JG688_00011119 [Phytophthora aleatoria]